MRSFVNLAILLAITASTSCKNSHKVEQKPLAIEVATAEQRLLHQKRTFITNLSANYFATIQPRIAGFLASASFENGMPVKAGQLLFTLNPSEQRANRLSAEASLSSAKAKAVEARRNYERAVPLARINAISQTQLDQYTAENSAAQASVKASQQSLENALLAESYTKIYAPINGIISSSNAHIGDYVGPGTGFTTLTTIQNIDTISVDLAIPMSAYLLASGRKSFSYENRGLLSDIRLSLADGSEYPLPGFYKFTRQSIASAMGTIVIVVGFPNPEYSLKDGQFARISANIGTPKQCIIIPQQAIIQRQNNSSVWVIRPDSTAEYRKVQLGDTYGSDWIIKSGIEEGEVVAITGLQKLSNGMKISRMDR